MHVILTGATGLVGSSVLDALIKAKDITKITILSRRPVQMASDAKDPRINVVIQKDFNRYDSAVLDQLRGASSCVWALGISQNKVTKEEYVAITKDYALAAARSFTSLGEQGKEPFRFVFVSGEGATQTPGYFSPFFARVKGETETALADMAAASSGALRTDVVRPGFVDARTHDAIKPYVPEHTTIEKVSIGLMAPVITSVVKGMHSPTEMLGGFFAQLAMGRLDGKLEGPGTSRLNGSWIVQASGVRRAMGL